jgi:hypothetical protein
MKDDDMRLLDAEHVSAAGGRGLVVVAGWRRGVSAGTASIEASGAPPL